MTKILTGIKPTGEDGIHLGNYLGAIRPAIERSKNPVDECYYFIADYHALTSWPKPEILKKSIYQVAASWLALGLDPDTAFIYRQSDIPEILELHWILSCFTSKGILNRAHAYKARVQENREHQRDDDKDINLGLYAYPTLMACDILCFRAEQIPVGLDQVQHIEIARDIASSFNAFYGNILTLPEALVTDNAQVLPGIDGRKMSKSYGNGIYLFDTEKKLRKTINRIVSDSSAPDAPKDPDSSVVFEIFKAVATEDQILEMRKDLQAGLSWGEAKARLFQVTNKMIEPARKKYQELMDDTGQIDHILAKGAERARPLAQALLSQVRKAIGR